MRDSEIQDEIMMAVRSANAVGMSVQHVGNTLITFRFRIGNYTGWILILELQLHIIKLIYFQRWFDLFAIIIHLILRFGSVLDRLGVTRANHRIDEYGGMWYEGKSSLLSNYL